MDLITNRQRLDYILDLLAEPFPEQAQLKAYACGDHASNFSAESKFPTKRELIESALLEALTTEGNTFSENSSLKDVFDALSDGEIGNDLIKYISVEVIDRHLNDLRLFSDPERPTELEEIVEWDTRHAKDLLVK